MIGADIVLQAASVWVHAAAADLVDATPEDALGESVAILAGDLAGLAAGARAGVEVEQQRLGRDRRRGVGRAWAMSALEPYLPGSAPALGALDLAHDGVLGVAEGKGRRPLGGQDVDVAAPVDAVLIRLPPGALGHVDDAGHQPVGERGRAGSSRRDRSRCAPGHRRSMLAAARIETVDEDALREGLLEPVVVVVRRVDAVRASGARWPRAGSAPPLVPMGSPTPGCTWGRAAPRRVVRGRGAGARRSRSCPRACRAGALRGRCGSRRRRWRAR